MSFPRHTAETASPAGAAVIDDAKQAFGFVPNLIAHMAEAPALARGYLALSELVGETSFSPTERHVVWFTINAEHDCRYCMAAHTGIAKSEDVPDDVIETARAVDAYDDPRLEALRQLTLTLVRERGHASEADVERFLDAGFTRQQVLEIVLVIAHKTMSNYTNHLADTEVDRAFAAHAWEKPAAATA